MGKQQFEELKQAAAPWPGPRLHVPREEAASGSGQQVGSREREMGVCAAVRCPENQVHGMCQLLVLPRRMRDTGRGAPLLLSECHLWSENTGSTRLPHLPWFAFVVLINKMGVSVVCFLSFYDLRAHGPGA